MWLRRVKELSQREIGAKLGLKQKAIERHLTKGARLLAQYMKTNTLTRRAGATNEVETDETEHEHGKHPTD
jgi:RNA polymerase sigma-70 factor (ECF subfamily)